jgi:two-component system sensor histidine kinase YesM
MESDILDFLIPKLTLQPIAENAIYHGHQGQEGPGLLQFAAGGKGTTSCSPLSDYGVGMDAQSLLRVATREGPATAAVGIKNVADRLRLYFGPD